MTKEFFLHANGKYYHRIYKTWTNMKSRCSNPKVDRNKYYYGKGIKVCQQWEKFSNFRDWAFSNGYHEGLSIDRIDNDKNYEPSNCRWVNTDDQKRDTTRNRRFVYKGKSLLLSEWSNLLKVKRSTLAQRFYVYNWSVAKTLTTK